MSIISFLTSFIHTFIQSINHLWYKPEVVFDIHHSFIHLPVIWAWSRGWQTSFIHSFIHSPVIWAWSRDRRLSFIHSFTCEITLVLWLTSIIHSFIHSFTCDMSLKSWLTSIIPPSKSLIASASASIVSISRWLVGSSSRRRCGRCHASHANVTRHRWPSERLRIGHV